jgi:hypothetical protein
VATTARTASPSHSVVRRFRRRADCRPDGIADH